MKSNESHSIQHQSKIQIENDNFWDQEDKNDIKKLPLNKNKLELIDPILKKFE